MKTLSSNWNIVSAIQNKGRVSKRGLTMFESKLDQITGANRTYRTAGISPRVACVRRKGKNVFQVVGGGLTFQGNFASLKNHLALLGYTGAKMGAVKVSLSH